MNLHLAEIATEVAPGAHAVLVLDQAGSSSPPPLSSPPYLTETPGRSPLRLLTLSRLPPLPSLPPLPPC